MTTVIVGATAVGKSSLALALAGRYAAAGRRAEIVSADSMQVYRGMDIGTAKPSAEERAEVRHHLVDIMEITETATVAQFQRLARAAIADCLARNVVPLVVGGSALYVRAIVDDFDFPGTDPSVRAALEAEVDRLGLPALHARLTASDPVAAEAILPGNRRRIVRALEVQALTGKGFSAVLPEQLYLLSDVIQIGLDTDREDLNARIAARVDQMWQAGLVAEVTALAARGLAQGLTASRALGYRQILRFLDGEISEAESLRETVVGTRKFARRQAAWFRADDRIQWLNAGQPDLVDQAYALSSGNSPAPAGPLVKD